MGLRIARIDSVPPVEQRTPSEWRALIEATLTSAAAGLRAGSLERFAAAFDEVAGWQDEQRRYQAERQLAELALGAGELVADLSWTALYTTAVEGLAASLDRRPAEPVLLNYTGVLLYELVELESARACFDAALRLDPELEHVRANLSELERREREQAELALVEPLAARLRTAADRASAAAAVAGPASGMTLTLAMIVKDEEEMLPGCLAAVRGVVDEIVVVDTGSSDRTVEIAESFGARVVRFAWTGSFAEARNVSLEHATGDWVMYLDADEHLVVEDAPKLRGLLGRTWREAFYLVETNYTGGEDSGHAVTHMALRIFRNRPEYRFEGRIHEQKAQSMPTFLPERFESTTIRLRHYGYLKSRVADRDKTRRNVELLEQERREAPSPFNAFNLGSEHMAIGEWQEARRYLDEAWSELRSQPGFAAVPYAPLLVARVARACREAGDAPAARAAIAAGLDAFPDHTDLRFEEAMLARDEGDLDGASALALRCLEMGDAPARYAATVGCGSHLALVLLGEIRVAQHRPAEAEELYARALAEHPDFVGPVLRLAALMLRRDCSDEEVAAAVPTPGPSAMLLLATAFHEAGRHVQAERRFRRVLERQPGNDVASIGLVESLLSQRRYAEAASAAAAMPADAMLKPLAYVSELFAAAVRRDLPALDGVLARAAAGGAATADLELYRAWRALLAGSSDTGPLPATLRAPLATALEALLRVHEFEGFEQLLDLLERAVPEQRDRHELLAAMYLRLGFLDSAADEWLAVARDAPDPRALLGLAQIALARGFRDDAVELAEATLRLEPANEQALRLLRASRAAAALASAAA